MSAVPYCSRSNNEVVLFNAAFLEFGFMMPVFIILQLILLIHTIYHEYIQRNEPQYQNISMKLRVLFFLLQIVGLFWTFIDFLGFVIDPFTSILRGNIGCDIAAYSPQIVPIIYYGLYLYQVLLRLELSFKGSYLSLSSRSKYILSSFILFPLIIVPILFFISNKNSTTCVCLWKPMDFPGLYTDESAFSFCFGQLGAATNLIVVIGILWVAAANIIFGVLFSSKLKKLLSKTEDSYSERIKLRFKKLIIKNTILSITGSISTIGCWMLWIVMVRTGYKLGFGAMFLYLDLFINCMCIGLMFKYNEKNYKKICKCFILMCLKNCDKTKHKMGEQQVMEYVNGEIDLSSKIASTTREISTPELQKVQSMSDNELKQGDNNDFATPMTPQSNPQSPTDQIELT